MLQIKHGGFSMSVTVKGHLTDFLSKGQQQSQMKENQLKLLQQFCARTPSKFKRYNSQINAFVNLTLRKIKIKKDCLFQRTEITWSSKNPRQNICRNMSQFQFFLGHSIQKCACAHVRYFFSARLCRLVLKQKIQVYLSEVTRSLGSVTTTTR